MSKYLFNVNLSPLRAFNLIKDNINGDLVDEEYREVGDGKYFGILVFEKYYMRVGNRASLVVIIDNIDGKTKVKSIGAGGGTGMFLSFDWGASDDFAYSVEEILKAYIIE
jgi:hypothetical protein